MEVVCERVVAQGKCVARAEDGRVMLVEGALPGERVVAKVTKERRCWLEGRAVRYLNRNRWRRVPRCVHFGECGGCLWQDVDYGYQLELKREVVRDAFHHIAGLRNINVKATLPAPLPFYYRSKLEFSVGQNGKVGFHKRGSWHQLVDIIHCWLQPNPSNTFRNVLRRVVEHNGMGVRAFTVKVTRTGEMMCVVETYSAQYRQLVEELVDVLVSLSQPPTSVWWSYPSVPSRALYELTYEHMCGALYVKERVLGKEFMIGPASFFQPNLFQVEALYRVAIEMASPCGEDVVLDLYCGVGTISVLVAGQVRQVVGVEVVEEAVELARMNASLNGVENTVFVSGRAEEVLRSLEHNGWCPTLVIADPARAGMHPSVVKCLGRWLPERIVYVSCHPATQARDVGQLLRWYEVREVQPVDMFPHTPHVESVVLLVRR